MIVVLRGLLGAQVSIVQKEIVAALKQPLEINNKKELQSLNRRLARLLATTQALGALTLGDIDDDTDILAE